MSKLNKTQRRHKVEEILRKKKEREEEYIRRHSVSYHLSELCKHVLEWMHVYHPTHHRKTII